MGAVFHLCLESEFQAGLFDGVYRPRRYAQDGFVHCAGDPQVTLEVASSYFVSAMERVLVVQVELARLRSPVRWEPPAPIPGGGAAHHRPPRLFPHVYGPLPLEALKWALLPRTGDGFSWPAEGAFIKVGR